MKWTNAIKETFKGMSESISRFPLTSLFLVAITGLNALTIENTDFDFTRLIFTFVIGAMLGVVGQMVYERLDMKETLRYGLFGGVVILTLLYYFIIGPQHDFSMVMAIKTGVALFALLIAFIWIPTINNEIVPFHRSFLAIVKAFFTTLLFTLVLATGITAIFSAIMYLLFEIDSVLLVHLMNIVVSLFAPLLFLSLTPLYPSTADDAKSLEHFKVPRFLEVLISYIIIPIVAIYTLILVIYVVMNFTGDFWTDNLLEPLLVSYAISVIIVLILSYNIENRFTTKFRQIFPKILLPIVIFQTIASILKIGEMGITHGRYYVIMFGIFAIITSLIFGFFKIKYQGVMVISLLVLTAISIIPPIDAFTISKKSQINVLEETLERNNMLEDNEIIPNNSVSVEDKIVITKTANYLQDLDYNEDVIFLPENYELYNDFDNVFGFSQTYSETDIERTESQYFYLDEVPVYVVDIAEYHVMMKLDFIQDQPIEPIAFEVNNELYTIEVDESDDYYAFTIVDSEGVDYIVYNTKEIFDSIFGKDRTLNYNSQNVTVEDATFNVENEQVKLSMLVHSIERSESYKNIQFTLYINIK